MRTHLVTKFCCAGCGNLLSADYKTASSSPYSAGEPTGADMVQVVVSIAPCPRCFEPVNKMKVAVRAFLEAAGK